jgi:uncharacterized protein
MLSRRSFLGSCLGIGAAASSVGWYSGFYEPTNIEIVRRIVNVPGLPTRLSGLTAVQVSDLHLVHTGEVHVKMVEQVQTLRPDVIFVTGDLVDDQSAVADAVGLLQNLSPPRGIWAVAGNWDHTANAVDALSTSFEKVGMHFLVNESRQLEEGLWIVGVDDPSTASDNLDDALTGVPGSAHRILLAHSPDIVDSLERARFDLILAGHTHGGQINLPMASGGWVKNGPTRQYLQGLFHVNGSPMYVNRGIGVTHIPIRLGARPEITHFTFVGN